MLPEFTKHNGSRRILQYQDHKTKRQETLIKVGVKLEPCCNNRRWREGNRWAYNHQRSNVYLDLGTPVCPLLPITDFFSSFLMPINVKLVIWMCLSNSALKFVFFTRNRKSRLQNDREEELPLMNGNMLSYSIEGYNRNIVIAAFFIKPPFTMLHITYRSL